MSARYITTTLPYVNADPHIGFALELVQGDVLARFLRARGHDVFFNTGTDEHGQKIYESALKAGQSVEDYVNHYAGEVKKLKELLNLSYDAFVRTTDDNHKEAAQEIWKQCSDAGDIYKKSYTGLYCVGCEAYKTEREINEGKCVIHPHLTLEEITEENYFFRLSKYQDALVEYLSDPSVIIPEWRRVEALNFVKEGLEDFSISRNKERLSWGVPVPGDESQVMYVWFDALTNYISTLGWPNEGGNFEKFWADGDTLQMAGKDQIRFQSIMWQAMLMSANLPLTKQVFYHGFINSGGQKMSKSLGNVIHPYDVVQKYGIDATRYMLLRHIHPVDDSDMTNEKLDEWYTANLVNGLGNFVARIMTLAETHLTGPLALSPEDVSIDEKFITCMEEYRFNEAMDVIWESIGKGDLYMTESAPFKKIKSDNEEEKAEARHNIEKLVRHIAQIAAHLTPILPKTAEIILSAIAENKKPENLFPRLS